MGLVLTGIAPNQPPMRFIRDTDKPIEVTEGVGVEGSKACESDGIAMILLSVVSGIWPRPACNAPVRNADGVGIYNFGVQTSSEGRDLEEIVRRERVRPRRNMARAYGILRREMVCVVRRKKRATSPQRRLSCQEGWIRPRGWRSVLPEEMMSERPAPTWMPLITGTGIL